MPVLKSQTTIVDKIRLQSSRTPAPVDFHLERLLGGCITREYGILDRSLFLWYNDGRLWSVLVRLKSSRRCKRLIDRFAQANAAHEAYYEGRAVAGDAKRMAAWSFLNDRMLTLLENGPLMDDCGGFGQVFFLNPEFRSVPFVMKRF